MERAPWLGLTPKAVCGGGRRGRSCRRSAGKLGACWGRAGSGTAPSSSDAEGNLWERGKQGIVIQGMPCPQLALRPRGRLPPHGEGWL